MAKAKEPGSEVAVESQSTAVVAWQDEIKKLAIKTAETEKPSGSWVSFKNGVMKINDTPMKDNKVEMVVLEAVFENQFYKNRYDPNKAETPICYALGENDEDLAPHPNSPEPQNVDCATCSKNAWGSDPQGGKGKACKNVRRLAIIAANDLGNVPKAQVALAKLPVTSVKNWATYASQIANVLHLPPLAVVTEMREEPDAKNQFVINFELIRKIEDGEVLQALLNKRKDIHSLAYAPYEVIAEQPAQENGAPKKY